MSSSELEDYLQEHQNERLRVVMSSGDEVIIEEPQKTVIGGLSLHIQMYGNWTRRQGPKVRIVSIPNINIIEPISPGSNGRRSRRRR
jgi:hypothetical protein